MNQIFINCKFNLRKASSLKPMPVYLVVYISGKQYKIATGVKVLPFQWDKSRQMAIVSNIFNEIDNYNNTIVNEKLSAMREQFSNYLDYLCTHNENATDLFKHIFCKGMPKSENNTMPTADAIKIIKRAFSVYYTEINTNAKESTQDQQRTNLKKFMSYVSQFDNVVIKEILSQRSINDFRSYLIKNQLSPKNINACGGVIVTLINKVISALNEFLCYNVTPVKWTNVKDTRTKDDNNKHFPLTNDEIQAIKDCETLTPTEKQVRNIFLLQCACGLRINDVPKLIFKQYERKNGYYYIQTQKETGEIAMVKDCDEINNLIALIESDTHINFKVKENSFTSTINRHLRKLAKKSGLNRLISGKDAHGKEYTKPVYDHISSHCARYTFITNMCLAGMDKKTLILLTGHSTEIMINAVYERLTREVKANMVDDAFAEMGKSNIDDKKSDPEKEKVNVKDFAFAYSLVKSCGNRYDLPVVKTIIKTIKSTSKINACLDIYNKADESKREQFAADIKSLDNFYYELARINNDADIYKAYQYKQKLFGLIDDVLTDEIIEQMWINDEIEYNSDDAQAQRFFDRYEKK